MIKACSYPVVLVEPQAAVVLSSCTPYMTVGKRVGGGQHDGILQLHLSLCFKTRHPPQLHHSARQQLQAQLAQNPRIPSRKYLVNSTVLLDILRGSPLRCLSSVQLCPSPSRDQPQT